MAFQIQRNIYCRNIENDGLYITSLKGDSKKLGAGLEHYFVFNKEHTQLIFFVNGSCCVTDKGSDKVKISDSYGYVMMVVPDFTSIAYSFSNKSYDSVITYGIEKLSEHFYSEDNNDNLFYINKDWSTKTIASDVDDWKINHENSRLYYTKNDSLYRVNNLNDSDAVSIADDVAKFTITSDGKAVYYIDNMDTLWYRKGTKKAKQISNDVYSLSITHDDYALFITEYSSNSGLLFSSKNGNNKSQISDNAFNVKVTNVATYYYANYNYENYTSDLYGTTTNTTFDLIDEGISA